MLFSIIYLATLVLATTNDLSQWIDQETSVAQTRLLANISPSGGAPGSVTAAQSHTNPDYWYHWVRDAGIALTEVSHWLNTTSSANLDKTMQDYSHFSRALQTAGGTYGLGTAKYLLTGTPYTGPWCMPQRDGPALRALSFIGYAYRLLQEGKDVSEWYDSKLPTQSLIKTDLEYVSHNWQVDDMNCDIWEEVRGHHFYTRMVQRKALVEGAQLAQRLGDPGAAQWYQQQAEEITQDLGRFWDAQAGHLRTTLDFNGGVNYKTSNLDSQIMLAALHGGMDDGVYTVESDRMLATAVALIDTFGPLYPINKVKSTTIGNAEWPIAWALGRYPEDKYTGYNSNGPGNPWSLITSGMAEYHYRLVGTWNRRSEIKMTQGLSDLLEQMKAYYGAVFNQSYTVGSTYQKNSPAFNEIAANTEKAGDMYMARVARHTDANGQMFEEWNLNTGYGQGAPDLTWSYAAHLSAARHRV